MIPKMFEKLCNFLEPLHDEAFAFCERYGLYRKSKNFFGAMYNLDIRKASRKVGASLAQWSHEKTIQAIRTLRATAIWTVMFFLAITMAGFGLVLATIRYAPCMLVVLWQHAYECFDTWGENIEDRLVINTWDQKRMAWLETGDEYFLHPMSEMAKASLRYKMIELGIPTQCDGRNIMDETTADEKYKETCLTSKLYQAYLGKKQPQLPQTQGT